MPNKEKIRPSHLNAQMEHENHADRPQKNTTTVTTTSTKYLTEPPEEYYEYFTDDNEEVSSWQIAARKHLVATIQQQAAACAGSSALAPRLAPRTCTSREEDNERHINSIVWTLQPKGSGREALNGKSNSKHHATDYVLVILDANDKVDIARLQTIVADLCETDYQVALTPSEQLVETCGFVSGTVPPLGCFPAPLVTLVESSLLLSEVKEDSESASLAKPTWLVGGGGKPEWNILVSIDTLIGRPDVHVAQFRYDAVRLATTPQSRPPASLAMERHSKPFFVVAPPPVSSSSDTNDASINTTTIQPEWVSVVGRISGVRRMARRLAFIDLHPPPILCGTQEEENDLHPWRSPVPPHDSMAVQLIAGKTLLQHLGGDDTAAEALLKRLKPNQLVWVQGKTNVGNRNSLQNWYSKTSLDIVVWQLQILQTDQDDEMATPLLWASRPASAIPSVPNNTGKQTKPVSSREACSSNLPTLQLHDVYAKATMDKTVSLVHSLETLKEFEDCLSKWVKSLETQNQVGLVGLDGEWKPNFLLEPTESQPVLLFQICLWEAQQVFLLDLQSLLRPLLPKSAPDCDEEQPTKKTETEQIFENTMALLYSTPRLIKIGFQVQNDLQRLAVSYPHIDSLQQISSVLEVSKLGNKVLEMQRHRVKARAVTSSLSQLVGFVLERDLDKIEQVSDWSERPLSPSQMKYAAFDAMVTPCIARKLMEDIQADLSISDKRLHLGRYAEDVAFTGLLTNWRFLLVSPVTQPLAVQRWNAKRLIAPGSQQDDVYWLVSQAWNIGESTPALPTLPENEDPNAPFVDLHGIRKIPSNTIELDPSRLHEFVGREMPKSKERCALDLLEKTAAMELGLPVMDEQYDTDGAPVASQLEFQARSGYVELRNGACLFVTLPLRDGQRGGGSRSYPNEWVEDGSILTWFIKNHEWKDGTSRLAQTMLDDSNHIVLFVRRGKGVFYCCGECRVVSLLKPHQYDASKDSDQWTILRKLFLLLKDYPTLQSNPDFQTLVYPGRK